MRRFSADLELQRRLHIVIGGIVFFAACIISAPASAGKICEDIECGNGVLGPFEACDDDNTTNGDGCDEFCRVEDNFECDGDSDCVSRDCYSKGKGEDRFCRNRANCGNGTVDWTEGCDDENRLNGDGCSSSCLVENGGECSDDEDCMSEDCGILSNVCEGEADCGNGDREDGEACDDGNIYGGDGCSENCLLEDDADTDCNRDWECESGLCDRSDSDCEDVGACGNGLVEAGEGCDDSDSDCLGCLYLNEASGCRNDEECLSGECEYEITGCGEPEESNECVPQGTCWDGMLDPDEGCDEFDPKETDRGGGPCNPITCLISNGEPCNADTEGLTGDQSCGSGVCDMTEGGSGVCEEAETCGNGRVETGEGCDDGNEEDEDGCNGDCKIEEGGSGCVTDQECESEHVCDRTVDPAVCEKDDTCGNGRVEPDEGEGCDDGNTDNGDGCNSDCLLELGEACESDLRCETELCDNTKDPSVCAEPGICANGRVEAGEGCDDGNTDDGDGCTADCLLELEEECDTNGECDSGFCNQFATPDVCAVPGVCGNGVVEDGEVCDDGNDTAGDGCSAECTLEDGADCEEDDECASGFCGALGECAPSDTRAEGGGICAFVPASSRVGGTAALLLVIAGIGLARTRRRRS